VGSKDLHACPALAPEAHSHGSVAPSHPVTSTTSPLRTARNIAVSLLALVWLSSSAGVFFFLFHAHIALFFLYILSIFRHSLGSWLASPAILGICSSIMRGDGGGRSGESVSAGSDRAPATRSAAGPGGEYLVKRPLIAAPVSRRAFAVETECRRNILHRAQGPAPHFGSSGCQ